MRDDKTTLQMLYDFICKSENIQQIPLKFQQVGKGGGVCVFTKQRPLYIAIDLQRICIGAAYALCHEVAHQVLILKGNHTHNREFKALERELVAKYATCAIASRLVF